jgi:hypothetical protein
VVVGPDSVQTLERGRHMPPLLPADELERFLSGIGRDSASGSAGRKGSGLSGGDVFPEVGQ